MTDAPLPLVRRDDLVRAQLPHLARAAGAAPVRVGITGSGPDLLVLTWSAADLARERAAGARLLTRLGVRPGVPVANALPGALATPGSLLLGDVIEEIGALDVPLGPAGDAAAAAAAWALFDRVRPEVLVLDAGGAALLAAAPPAERPWWRGIVWLRTATSVPPRVRPPAGFGGWQRVWLAVPEATSFVAHTCARGTFHLDEEVRAEVVGAGCARTLVLTALGFESRLLRYVTGLDARLLDGPCACGAAGAALLLG
jgi:hypothetical protein